MEREASQLGESSHACIYSKTLKCTKGLSALVGPLRQAMATVPCIKPLTPGATAFC